MFKRRGLAFKLILVLFVSNAIIFSLIFFNNYVYTRAQMEEEARQNIENLTTATVNQIETVLNPVQKIPQMLAAILENSGDVVRDELTDWLLRLVEQNSDLSGLTIAFEPYAFNPDSIYFAPSAYRRSGSDLASLLFLGSETYSYFSMDWYQIPKLLQKPIWSEPFYSEEGGSGLIMSTYSVPFYHQVGDQRLFWGVVTADISLEQLRSFVAKLKIYQSGYGVLISQNGTYITHPQAEWVMNESIFSKAEEQNDPNLRRIGQKMIGGERGLEVIESPYLLRQTWLAFAPLPSSGWSLALVLLPEEVLAGLNAITQIVILMAAGCFIVLFLVILLIARSFTRPITALAKASQAIATGNLEGPLPKPRSQDELGQLTRSFASMQSSLKEYIADLKQTTAAKERIESELKIGRDIQMGMISKIFPPYPDHKGFNIFASMEAARMVGGDLYDFLLTSPHQLCFIIGDVSGKGVPASLFMAVTISLFRSAAAENSNPVAILTKLNDQLCQNNPSSMFVTAFCGLLDLRNGNLQLANAGHNPPYVLHGPGQIEPLTHRPNPALGVIEEARFVEHSLCLKGNEFLYTYTDGVTEAMDENHQLYGEDRLEQVLAAGGFQSPEELLSAVSESIRQYVAGTEQSDDITMLAIQYLTPELTAEFAPCRDQREFHLVNRIEQIGTLAPMLAQMEETPGFPADLLPKLDLVLDELLTNTISYGYTDGAEHWITIRLSWQPDELTVELEDDALPFNPLEQTTPNLNIPLEERSIGGLGIHLVRHLTEQAEYQYRDGKNRLRLTIKGG
jgi:sigma-B regulation protein RsbU (phosphoserine phosphatase)